MDLMPFHISMKEKIESGDAMVVTRNGKDVRIVCWDAIKDVPVVAVVDGLILHYYEDGRMVGTIGENEAAYDLMVKEPERPVMGFLPVWKKAPINDKGWRFYSRCIYHDGYTLSFEELLKLPKND